MTHTGPHRIGGAAKPHAWRKRADARGQVAATSLSLVQGGGAELDRRSNYLGFHVRARWSW